LVFFGWETAFNRNAMYNLDTNSQDVSKTYRDKFYCPLTRIV
jgi:hypothetical protein